MFHYQYFLLDRFVILISFVLPVSAACLGHQGLVFLQQDAAVALIGQFKQRGTSDHAPSHYGDVILHPDRCVLGLRRLTNR